jgi:hypothetical protein
MCLVQHLLLFFNALPNHMLLIIFYFTGLIHQTLDHLLNELIQNRMLYDRLDKITNNHITSQYPDSLSALYQLHMY